METTSLNNKVSVSLLCIHLSISDKIEEFYPLSLVSLIKLEMARTWPWHQASDPWTRDQGQTSNREILDKYQIQEWMGQKMINLHITSRMVEMSRHRSEASKT